jgi:XrtN system VIT domain protein
VLFRLRSGYRLARAAMASFQDSVDWLNVALVASATGYLALGFLPFLKPPLQYLVTAILGVSLVLFTYLSCYLFPIYPFAGIVAIVFGVSLLCFAPIAFVIFTIYKWEKLAKENGVYSRFIVLGIALALVPPIIFNSQWNAVNKHVSRLYRKSLFADNTDLPGWITLAKTLPQNSITEKYFKSNLVYTTPSSAYSGSGWGMPTRNFNEGRILDPLIMIAGLFSPVPDLSEEERI